MRAVLFFLILVFVSKGELVWETQFTEAQGYVAGEAAGQGGWSGDSGWTVDPVAETATLSVPGKGITYGTPVTLSTWDSVMLKAVVALDFARDVNQVPLRLGFTASVGEDSNPVVLPEGVSWESSTALACEVFRDGWPYLQTEGVTHHSGTVYLRPHHLVTGSGAGFLSGNDAGIYPHARMGTLTAYNGDGESVSEVQTLAAVPLAGGAGLGDADGYRLGWGGEQTIDLFRTTSASGVQAALEALPSVGAGNVTVSGDYTYGYGISFGGSLAGVDLPQLEVTEPGVVDHVTQDLEITYELLKTATPGRFRVDVRFKNLETGVEVAAPTYELNDPVSYYGTLIYPAIRGGGLVEGGSLVLNSMVLEREAATADSDGDTFTNGEEYTMGSDPFNASDTPLGSVIVAEDFSDETPGFLNDSPDWRATPNWEVLDDSGRLVADLPQGANQRALTEGSITWGVGEALVMEVEMRVKAPVNFPAGNQDLFEIGFTDEEFPGGGGSKVGFKLSSLTNSKGELLLTIGSELVDLGVVGPFFDLSGYDTETTGFVIPGGRSSGPSDWMKMTLIAKKSEVEGDFELSYRFVDLEGDHRGREQGRVTVTDVPFWESGEVRALFGSFNPFFSSIAGGVQVRQVDVSKVNSGDFEQDGLPNDLELFYGTSPKLSDTDGDGQADLFEIERGSDPLDIGSTVTSIPVKTESATIELWGYVEFRIVAAPGARAVLEQSSDLIQWTSLPNSEVTIDSFGAGVVSDYPGLFGVKKKYFRVKVILP